MIAASMKQMQMAKVMQTSLGIQKKIRQTVRIQVRTFQTARQMQ